MTGRHRRGATLTARHPGMPDVIGGTQVAKRTPVKAADTHARPQLRQDFIAKRRTGADQVRILSQGFQRHQPHKRKAPPQRYPTVTLTFTANHLIDDLVQQLAMEMNLSRSAAIRQAILDYHHRLLGGR